MKWLKKIILSEADNDNNEVEEPATMEEEEDTGDDENTDTAIEDTEEPVTASSTEAEGDTAETDNEGEVTGDNSSPEEVDEPTTHEDIDDGDETEEPTEDNSMDGEGGEDTDDMGDETEGDEITAEDSEYEQSGNTENENLKKLKLVDEYKELYDIVTSMKDSLNNLEGKVDQRKTEILDHTERIVATLLSDITFVITNRFTDNDYKTLLTNFYQFKFQLNSVMKVIEFLIQDEEK